MMFLLSSGAERPPDCYDDRNGTSHPNPVEELPEGLFLATSDEVAGLVAQGRTVAEALDVARDVARKLIEARREREGELSFTAASEQRDYTIVVAA